MVLQGDFVSDEYTGNRVLNGNRMSTFEARARDCGYPDNITEKALEIHQQMCDHVSLSNKEHIERHGFCVEKKLVFRKNNTQMLIFSCIAFAHYEFGLQPILEELARRCKVKSKDIPKAFSLSCESSTGYHPINTTTDPFDMLPKYYLWLKLPNNNYHFVEEMAKRILKKDPNLLENHPGTVSGAILAVYCNNRGIHFDGGISAADKIVEIASCPSIKNMMTRVEKLDE